MFQFYLALIDFMPSRIVRKSVYDFAINMQKILVE